jgi:glycosyltransferase involved in cell wall biosynthesis
MKLRLAVFNTQPPLFLGGVERRILETSKRLLAEIETTVYSGTKAGFRESTFVDGAKVIPCASTDRVFPLDNWTFNRTLSKMTGSIKADVYESHTVSGYGFQKALKRQGVRVPFITTVHGVLADEYAQARLRGGLSTRTKAANFFMKKLSVIEEESARDATLIVTISKYSRRKIIELYGVDPEKIRVVPNGVDPERFKPAVGGGEKFRERIGAGNRQIVLFVGRLIPRKGMSYLVEAAKQVVKERSETLFVIVGSGPLKSHLTYDLEKAKLTRNFLFLGDVSEADLPLIYSCADVFAFPSIQEGQGIVLLEAQASAKPVVAFKLSGITEAVVDMETGVLVEPDVCKLAGAVLKLLSDVSLREKMGAAGRERILRELTWDICAQKMLGVYREALQAVRPDAF